MYSYHHTHRSSIPHLSTLLILTSMAVAFGIIAYAAEPALLQLAQITAERNQHNIVANGYMAVHAAGGDHYFAAGFVMIWLMIASWTVTAAKAITFVSQCPYSTSYEAEFVKFRQSRWSVTSICKLHSPLHRGYMKAPDILEVATRTLADDSRRFHTQPPQ